MNTKTFDLSTFDLDTLPLDVWQDDQTVEAGPYSIRVKIVPDYDADLSDLGTYTDRPKRDIFIDRSHGIVVDTRTGSLVHVQQSFGTIEEARAYLASLPHHDDHSDIDIYDAWDEEQKNIIAYEVEGSYWPILATDQHTMACREYRYFESSENAGTVEDLKDYGGVDEYVKYLIQDYDRAEDYNRGGWGYYGILATVSVMDEEVGRDSCWGFESDMEKADKLGAMRDVIYQALAQAEENAGNTAARLRAIADILSPEDEDEEDTE
jgi:hypothetical protein